MKTYLVTGAAGFIGSKVVEKLLQDSSIKVIGIDNLNDYYDIRLKNHRLALLQTNPRFEFHKVDIESLEKLRSIFEVHPFDAILNPAARAGVHYSMENPHIYLSTNAQGTLNLLELMRAYAVRKMVLASTSSLYAGQAMPFKEDLPVNTPLSPYAVSKKAAELMAYSYYKLYGLDISILRYFTVFGPAGRPDMSIFRFIQSIDAGKPITLFGDGTQSRDFTYVDDVAEGSIAALKELGYAIINIGGGRRPVSLIWIIHYLEKLLGKKAIIDHHPFHQADLMETWANIDKAKTLIGWQPLIEVEKGLEQTVAWHQANRDWLHL